MNNKITVHTAANELGISRQMVLSYITKGVKINGKTVKLKAKKEGRIFLINRDSLDKFVLDLYIDSMFYKYFNRNEDES